MKVTLDLSQLLREGRITPEEYQKFSALAAREGGSVAFNILIAFGVVAVAGAALALVPDAVAGLTIGALLMAAGLVLLMRFPAWLVLANICILVAALMFGGGALILMGGTISGYLLLAAIFLAGSLMARSALLMMLSVLAVVGAAAGDLLQPCALRGLGHAAAANHRPLRRARARRLAGVAEFTAGLRAARSRRRTDGAVPC